MALFGDEMGNIEIYECRMGLYMPLLGVKKLIMGPENTCFRCFIHDKSMDWRPKAC
jgi:hypothetical protein